MSRIALLIPTIDQIGGAERQLLLLAQQLHARNHEVTIVALSGNGTSSTEANLQSLTTLGIRFVSLRMRKAWIDPRGWLLYLRWFRHARPEIIHTHLPHATWFARWVRLIAPVRVVVDTIHTSHTGGLGRRVGYRLIDWLSNHITCVSQPVADATLLAHMAHAAHLSVLPNGVVLPSHSSQPRTPNSPFTWIAVGRLSPVKDYPTLLRAFAALPKDPPSQLIIAGTGPEEENLRHLAAELLPTTSPTRRIQFAGFQPDIQPLLSRSDAFVLSSLWEGLPMGVIEAEAACLPIVATDGPGTREAMQSGLTGFLVPVANPQALAAAMARVMAMPPSARHEMGARGRQFVAEHFSLSSVVDRWEVLYAQLLSAHPAPSRRA